MPVALRKRSWEDHVTSHLGMRYSYDDLDLICWQGITNSNGTSTGPRERCASMPECRRRKPAAGSRGDEGDDGDGGGGGDGVPRRERILTSGLMEVACPSGHTGMYRTNEGTDQVPGTGSMPTMTDNDMHQSPGTSPGHGSGGGLSASVFSDIPDEGHGTGIEIVKNEVSIPGTLPTASEGSPKVCQEEGKKHEPCSVTEDTPTASSLDKAKPSHTQPQPKKEVKIGPLGSPETILTETEGGEGDLTDGVSVAMVRTSKLHPGTLVGEIVNSECLDFIQVSEKVLPPDISPKAEAPSSDSQSRCVPCRSENGGQLVLPHDLIVPSDLEAPWCFGLHKLNPILEVSSTESGEDAPSPEEEESDCPVCMVSTEPEDVTNGPVQVLQSSAGLLAEQGILRNSQIDELAEDCEASDTNQSDAEAKPKPQESPIRLRARKTCAAFSKKDRAETEVKEACTWLRAAGFPQYAQLYEDGEFPIEISSVTQDHDFLDRDAIDALCRRLNTLNKCALMRLEITPQRKRSEDSDDDEPCAISGRWTFQRESKRWSRLDMDVSSPPVGGAVSDQPSPPAGHLLRDSLGTSAESVLTDVSEQPEGGSQRGEGMSFGPAPVDAACGGSAASVCSSGMSDGPPSPLTLAHFPFQGRSASVGGGAKSTSSRAKSFLKRVESLRLRSSAGAGGRRRKKVPLGRLEIGVPVPKEGLDDEALRRFNCVDLAGSERSEAHSRAACYSTQTSSGSAASSQSETSSGSAVSTPSPVTRARSHSAAASAGKRAGMYLEGFDPLSLILDHESSVREGWGRGAEPSAATAHNNQRNLLEADERREDRVIFFYLPEDHKPGTFPRALADGRPSRRSDAVNHCAPRRVSATSLDSRMSFYDNVPFVEMGDEEEEEEEEEPQGMGAGPKMEALQRGRGFQRLVSAWSSADCGEEEEEEDDSDSAVDSVSPCPSSPSQRHLEEAENGSDQESGNNPPDEHDNSLAARERRDSGVGPSLSQTNRPQTLRWSSVLTSHMSSQLGCQSVVQMNLLHKYSLLKITALLEKHPPSSKHGFSWAVPKFMKRMKVRDFRGRSVFGVPLQVNVQRSGQPLPQGIQQAMFYLRHECLDQVGLFRKSGVKSRIQALRHMNESCGINGGGVSYEGQSAYDVADMLKQYFRDLPEPLLTSKLSDTFLQIYQYMPKEQWLQALWVALLLLPDENREVLLTLLCFLSDVTANAEENQMTCTNLAVCVAPSLFHLNTARRDASSPRMMSRKNALGKPDQRDLNENLAATHGLAHMIQECRRLFQIPEELSRCRKSYVEQALLPPRMEDMMEAQGYKTLVQESMEALQKEARDRFRGYDSCSTHQHAELACKKVHDGWSLRQWKACVEVGAGPQEVLRRIMSEQRAWDENLLDSRVLESLERSVDVYQYVRNSMAPHPPTDHVVLRSWLTDLPKGVCALVCVSVDHESAAVLGVRANVMTSRYYIEPCGPNKSRITHISRTDCRGRCPEWYNKLYGHLCVSELVRIRDSFICPLDK